MKLLYHAINFDRKLEILTINRGGAPPSMTTRHFNGVLVDIGVYKTELHTWKAEYHIEFEPCAAWGRNRMEAYRSACHFLAVRFNGKGK